MTNRWGAVAGCVEAPGPCQLLMSIDDAVGPTRRRRLWSRRFELSLPEGRHRLTVEDDRALPDPARHAGGCVEVVVEAGRTISQTFRLEPGAVVRAGVTIDGSAARFAHVSATHADGQRYDARTDGHGEVVLAGLRRGTWSLVAEDSRRERIAEPVDVELGSGQHVRVDLDVTLHAARVLVDARGAGARPLPTATLTLIEVSTGRRVEAPLRDGAADVRGLRPGAHRLVVPASLGHLGIEVDVHVDGLSIAEVVVPVGATLAGRVVQGRRSRAGQYAAVITLIGADGLELERTRCDERGRFELGTGLRTTEGLTVVATTGPETLHVTRAARADVAVITGVRHHLGQLELPVAGPRASWTPVTPVVGTMKLPCTRV